ncbi:hypothetical protein NA57DRAFT_78461 [Rhizodiscina lignyota]|uniref:Uncharacterized protein n=1 Tax=Rhizodiscina lignyota TaxID=1504668 RepID=A0A9P4IE49_9PEZI|nr:hypothetical protein NA57DRAFT_78461 [Rhizodiscina lignyota]
MQWLAIFEAWAVNNLLRMPQFHRAVHKLHGTFYRLRHGKPMEEMGGTNLDNQGETFLQHFKHELKAQLRGETKKKP